MSESVHHHKHWWGLKCSSGGGRIADIFDKCLLIVIICRDEEKQHVCRNIKDEPTSFRLTVLLKRGRMISLSCW